MIAIIDYGMGNLRSVQKAIEAVGSSAEVTSDPERVRHASKVVLPGVGAFADAMAELRRTGLGEAFCEAVHRGKPCLGVCLGLQLLFDLSLEDGEHAGLGLLPGRVVRFASRPGLKVPHMGWNTLRAPPARAAPGRSGRFAIGVLRPLLLRPARRSRRSSPPRPIIPIPSRPLSGATTSRPVSSTPRRARKSAWRCMPTSSPPETLAPCRVYESRRHGPSKIHSRGLFAFASQPIHLDHSPSFAKRSSLPLEDSFRIDPLRGNRSVKSSRHAAASWA